MTPRAKSLFIVFVLFLLGYAAYGGSLDGAFVYDDKAYIVENDWLRSPWNLADLVGSRYLTDITFALNYAFGGLDPRGYHLVNLVLHLANSALVFLLVSSFAAAPAFERRGAAGRAAWAGAAAALIFAVHPLGVQSVTYVSQRYTTLATFFYLLTAVLFLRARASASRGRGSRTAYAVAALSAVAAMKSKEIAFTLPAALVILDLYLHGGRGFSLRRHIPFMAAMAVIPASLLLPELGVTSSNPVEETMRTSKLGEVSEISRYSYLLTQSKVILAYISLIFVPTFMSFNPAFPLEESLADPGVASSAAVVAVLVVLSFYFLYRSARNGDPAGTLVSLGLVWFFIAVSVESSVIPIKDTYNERRLYLPSAGMIISAAGALVFYGGDALSRVFGARRAAVVTALAVLLAAGPLAWATHQRNLLWADPLTLYRAEVRKNPESASPRMYLGIEYFERGMPEKALEQFLKARDLKPDSVHVHRTLATYYWNAGLLEESLAETRTIAELDPENTAARYNMGVIYMKTERPGKARDAFLSVLEIKPGDEQALRALDRLASTGGEG